MIVRMHDCVWFPAANHYSVSGLEGLRISSIVIIVVVYLSLHTTPNKKIIYYAFMISVASWFLSSSLHVI